MKMLEINPQNQPVVLLIHPMLSSAEGMNRALAQNMGGQYRYLIPDLAGHGKAADQTYESAAAEARAIHEWLAANHAGHLALAFGASLGAAVLMELMRYPDVVFDHIWFEGASFFTGAPLMEKMLKFILVKKHRLAAADPALSVQKMAAMFGPEQAEALARQFIAMDEASIRNVVHSCGNVNLPDMSHRTQAKCTFCYGEKDRDLKKAKDLIPSLYPLAKLNIWPGLGHCSKLSSQAEEYSALLKNLLEENS